MNRQIEGLLFAAYICLCSVTARAGSIEFSVVDEDNQPLPCRIHLKDSSGDVVKSASLPFWRDHFVCDGNATVDVQTGRYSWVIERGPEFRRASGKVEVNVDQSAIVALKLQRITSLRDKGWYSGDLHVHRSVADIKLLMMAEDLDYAPVIQWWNSPAKNISPVAETDFRFDGHRIYSLQAGEDEREGGALLYVGLNRPLDLTVQSREVPSPMFFVQQAREINDNVWIDIEKPFWWDVPTWLSSGKMNSIGIANNHMNRSGMYESEAWGKPRDTLRLPSPLGNGVWTQEIYYHILESGIRIPPSAGSASGVLRNPVGYNRVYVHLGDDPFTRQNWFRALAAGRSFVTNGPLLRVKSDGHLPGATLKFSADETRTIKLDVQLSSVDRVAAVEVIYNGRVVKRVPCSNSTDQRLAADLIIDRPGWFLIRALTDVKSTFRFASTAPWYVESGDVTHRISRTSAQFFVRWVNQRIQRIVDHVKDGELLKEVLAPHERARAFWLNRLAMANANLDDQSPSDIENTSLSVTRLQDESNE